MAYEETLADRVRQVVAGLGAALTERRMFGGLAFLLNGHMFVGIVGDELVLRLGEPAASAALPRRHVREMDFTGRPMKGMVFVQPAGLKGRALAKWIGRAAEFAQTLPPK